MGNITILVLMADEVCTWPVAPLRVVEWVALIRFLFGMWHYQSTLDFAFLF